MENVSLATVTVQITHPQKSNMFNSFLRHIDSISFDVLYFRFYSNNSAFVHGGVEVAGCEQPPVIGQEVTVPDLKLH